jgi:gibberellin 2-oxidase
MVCGGRALYEEANLVFRNLAMEILDILIQGLGVDGKHFQAHRNESQGVLRANYYHQSKAAEQVVGLVPHVDGNLFTILQQQDVSGLEVLKDGRWIPITPKNDAFCINVADIMQVGWLT